MVVDSITIYGRCVGKWNDVIERIETALDIKNRRYCYTAKECCMYLNWLNTQIDSDWDLFIDIEIRECNNGLDDIYIHLNCISAWFLTLDELHDINLTGYIFMSGKLCKSYREPYLYSVPTSYKF